MSTLNYAQQYSKELANAYPNVLHFGKLWNTENSSKYRVVDAKTVQIPTLSVGGRRNGNRDTIGQFSRNFNNGWETKTLENHRIWETLVHPKDVDETNQVASITNITKTMNEVEKFPEMDAYLISNLYKLKNDQEAIVPQTAELTEATVLKVFDKLMDEMDAYLISNLYKLKNDQEAIVPQTAELTEATVLKVFDKLMDEMDEAMVPSTGRIAYVDTFTKTLIDNAIAIARANGDKELLRGVSRIDEVDIVSVPSKLMKSHYTFEHGFEVGAGAKDIAMCLVHPSAVLPIVSYEFAQLQAPSAITQGKYVYFEESFEDVFILNERHNAIKFVVKKNA